MNLLTYLLTYLLTVLINFYTIELSSAVTLGGAWDECGAPPVGHQGHVIRCSGRQVCSSGVGYSCGSQRSQYDLLQSSAGPGCVSVENSSGGREGERDSTQLNSTQLNSILLTKG